MQNKLTKYKIGFGVLGIFTLVLAIMVLTQGAATKQDTETYNRAQKIADKLQDYTSNKAIIPSSLKVAGVTGSTDNITYTKINSESYKFCITYKTNTSFDASSITTQLYSGGLSSDGANASISDSAYLYVDYTHKKGENCKTVKPTLYSPYSTDKYNPYDLCSSSAAYSSCLNNGTGSGSSSTPDTNSSSKQSKLDACDKQYPSASQSNEYFACVDKVNGTSSSTSAQPVSGRIRSRTH